jgi:phosphatidylglycerophosphate synthase
MGGVQKTAKGAPAYSRFVNRRIGRYFAALAFAWGRTPNQVTALSAVFTFSGIAIVALFQPTALLSLTVCLALVVGYALDSADGQLARLRGSGSAAGEWLDHVVDSVKTSTIHAAVLICMFRWFDLTTSTPLLIPLAFGAVAVVWFFAVLLTDQLRRAHSSRSGTPMPTASTAAPLLRSLLVLPTDYGVLCLVFATLAWHSLFLVCYSVLLLGCTLFLAAALPTWYREMASFSSSV